LENEAGRSHHKTGLTPSSCVEVQQIFELIMTIFEEIKTRKLGSGIKDLLK
jgi:hypothetical protein